MESKNRIEYLIKSLSEELDQTPLPDQELHALSLADAIDTLNMAKFYLKLYKDR